MAPRTSPAVVQLAGLPEFLRSATVGELVAAALDEMARVVAGGGDEPDSRNPIANAHAEVYRHAAEQTRKFHTRGGE